MAHGSSHFGVPVELNTDSDCCMVMESVRPGTHCWSSLDPIDSVRCDSLFRMLSVRSSIHSSKAIDNKSIEPKKTEQVRTISMDFFVRFARCPPTYDTSMKSCHSGRHAGTRMH